MNIYGVKFIDNGKIYYFNGQNKKYFPNATVIVETDKGLQYGKIVGKIKDLEHIEEKEIRNIIRTTTKEDYKNYLKNLKDSEIALKKAQELADNLHLKMKFLTSSFTFDRRQLLLTFLADERIDFRELTKELAGIYKTRIELRQIGARDKASSIGGIGQCGRPLCCNTFLKNLGSVSMNMAKNQNLALNPNKINGSCGRLLCCLEYEDCEYKKMREILPNIGETKTIDGTEKKVISVDILNAKVVFQDKSGNLVEVDYHESIK